MLFLLFSAIAFSDVHASPSPSWCSVGPVSFKPGCFHVLQIQHYIDERLAIGKPYCEPEKLFCEAS